MNVSITARVLALAFAALLGMLSHATAQPRPPQFGDLVITGLQQAANRSLVISVTPGAAPVVTTLNTTTGGFHQWVDMWDDNDDLAVLTYDQAQNLSFLSRLRDVGGQLTRVAQINAPSSIDRFNDATGAAWDDQGRLNIVAGRSIYRYDPVGSSFTTVFRVPPAGNNQATLQDIAIGPDRNPRFNVGYYLLNARSPLLPAPPQAPFLFGYAPVAQTLTTVGTPNLQNATGIIYDYAQSHTRPPMRRFLATRASPTQSDLVAVDFRTGALTTLQRFPFFPQALTTTNERTAWIVGQRQGAPTVSAFFEVDTTNGAVLRTAPIPIQGFSATGIVRYGSNGLGLQGKAFKGDAPLMIGINGNDATLAGASYILALAFDSAPPAATLTIGTTMVDLNLALDGLFLNSVCCPAAVGLTGSTGVLDANGNATATLTLPPWVPTPTGGLNVYAAWVAYNGGGVLRVSETEVFVLP